MSTKVEFHFDFGSPNAYLAHLVIPDIEARTGVKFEYIPVLLGGVFKSTGNTSPVAIPAKGKYMLEYDLPRFAARYNVELNVNPHFPINTLTLMRAAIAAQHLKCFDDYLDLVFNAVWVQEKNMGDPEVAGEVLTGAGLDTAALLLKAQDPEVKAELVANTEAAVARGVFGAPTLFMDGAMYFGQDRFDFIEEALRA